MKQHFLIRLLGFAVFLVLAQAPAQTSSVPQVMPIPGFTKDARVLFQGDSITDGGRGRNQDPNHILGCGYVFIIAAKHGATFPELNLAFLNRGVSGNTVSNLAGRWPLDRFEPAYDKLLADARAANPSLPLVRCAPFTLPVGRRRENYEEWFAGIRQRQEIAARLARKPHAALVRFQRVFDAACQKAPAEHWIWDGVHPTYSGHQPMADERVRTVREFWPGPPGHWPEPAREDAFKPRVADFFYVDMALI